MSTFLKWFFGLLLAYIAAMSLGTESGKTASRIESAVQRDQPPRKLSKLEQIGRIHPALPKTRLLSAEESCFEIRKDARPGDEVVGRVNLANNSFERAHFSILGGTGSGLFSIEDYRSSKGKSFGVIKLLSDALSAETYSLRVKAEFDGGAEDEQEYIIHRVREPLAEQFLVLKEKEYLLHRRLYRQAPDREIEEYRSKMDSAGNFADLSYATGKKGWEDTCTAGERLLMFAVAYLDQNSKFFGDEDLKRELYRGVIRNAEQNEKFRTDWADTHVWRNSDFIAGIGIRFYRILRAEMLSEDEAISQLATEVYDAVLDVCDVMWAERMDERPAIGNANRNHRMRSLTTRAAISYDYNRALTDQDVWFDTVDPRIPGYYPNGALGDVMELIETNYIFADTYSNRNGFFPDGTICHHPRVGIQFTADAYGWAWLVENSIPMAYVLKNTRYRARNSTYDIIADRLLDAYRPLTYDGYLDMSVGGLLPDRSQWGPRLLGAVSGLLEARSDDTVIKREKELLEYQKLLKENNFRDELTLNRPFWNIDYIVHRRPDYFASAKMLSTRSRGLERGVDRRSYYYLGDGALFVRVNRDRYNHLRDVMNWHAIPGTTAEQRRERLPLAADSPFPGANGTNTFAGVVSDGKYGFGSFIYKRNHADQEVNYSTVNARKSYFFFEREIVALGNSVKRVRPGDGMDIWTTVDQTEWNGGITYEVNGDGVESVSEETPGFIEEFELDSSVAWFHQDRVGYVIVPTRRPLRIVMSAGEAVDREEGNGRASVRIFQLAINHGPRPEDDEYQYVVLPNVSVQDVQRFVNTVRGPDGPSVIANNKNTVAVRHDMLGLTQAVFYRAGHITTPLGNGEKMRLAVDRAALVMIRENQEGLSITVTDPNHSTTELTIILEVDRELFGRNAQYSPEEKVTRITVTHSAAEVYAGKPQSELFRFFE